jgi:PAS domain S-box-containing protein
MRRLALFRGEHLQAIKIIISGLLLCFAMVQLSQAETQNDKVTVEQGYVYNLEPTSLFIEDSAGLLDLESVQRRAGLWQIPDKKSLNFGYSQSKFWVKTQFTSRVDESLMLKADYPLMDLVDVWIYRNGSLAASYQTGDLRPYDSRPISDPAFVFKIDTSVGDHIEVFFRLQSDGSLTWPLTVMAKSTYVDVSASGLVMKGAYFGIMIVMVLYNLFIFLTIRQGAYGHYVVFVATFLFFQATYEGLSFQFFWPDAAWFNRYSLPLSYSLNEIAMIIFIRNFMELPKQTPRLDVYYRLLLIAAVGLLVGVTVLPYKYLVPGVVVLGLLITISGFVTGAYLWRKGNAFAHYFTVAWALLLIGLVLGNLRALGAIPSNFFTVHAYQLGAVCEVLLLSFALARRIDTAQKEKAQAEKAMIEAQRESILNLKRYQDLYDNAAAGMFQSDLTDRFIRVNGALATMFGYESPQQMVSEVKAISTTIAFDTVEMNKLFKDLLRRKTVMDREIKVYRQDRSVIWVAMTVRTVLNEHGDVDHLEGSVVNITERKDAEQFRQEEERKRMKALEEVVVGVAHEVNTPLGINLTSLNLIEERQKELKEKFESGQMSKRSFEEFISVLDDGVDLMSRNLKRIDGLIQSFRQVSVHHLGYAQSEFDLADILRGIEFSERVELGDVQLIIHAPERLDVCSYAPAFVLIFEKLIENSIQHGFIEDQADKTITIDVTAQPSRLLLSYRDNGRGLQTDDSDQIFIPFYTTQRGSSGHSGLGMYILFNVITQLLQGKVTVMKQQGFGVVMDIPRYLEVEQNYRGGYKRS